MITSYTWSTRGLYQNTWLDLARHILYSSYAHGHSQIRKAVSLSLFHRQLTAKTQQGIFYGTKWGYMIYAGVDRNLDTLSLINKSWTTCRSSNPGPGNDLNVGWQYSARYACCSSTIKVKCSRCCIMRERGVQSRLEPTFNHSLTI